MAEFLGFALIASVLGLGWAFAIPTLRRHRSRMEDGSADAELMARLLEDNEQLEARIVALEDEFRFFKELYPGDEPERLPPPGDGDPET